MHNSFVPPFSASCGQLPTSGGKSGHRKKQSKIMIIIVISIITAYIAGIYVGRNWQKFTTE